MIRYAVGTTNVVYQSIDVEGRPAVDTYVIITVEKNRERRASVLNWGETESFTAAFVSGCCGCQKTTKTRTP